MAKLRVFLSLNPDEGVISELEKIQIRLKKIYSEHNIRWEDPEKFHLTLRFLGDIDEADLASLAETLKRLKFDFESIIFETDKVGFFPESKYHIITVSKFNFNRGREIFCDPKLRPNRF